MKRVYLDWAATGIPDFEGNASVERLSFGNPSSIHAEGRAAATVLSESRRSVAGLLNAPEASVAFTSGGTESNNLLLLSVLLRPARGTILVSGIEHPSASNPLRVLQNFGWKTVVLPAARGGRIDPAELAARIDRSVRLVCIMAVNNETGAIQPLADIAAAVRSAAKGGPPVWIHSDAVQAFGRLPFDPAAWDLDSAAASAHKLGGPRGSGLLWTRKPFVSLISGGGQEAGLRPGTENTTAIAGFARVAAKCHGSLNANRERASGLMSVLIEGLRRIPQAKILPDLRRDGDERYSPYILCAAFPPLPGEVLVRALDEAGFAISTGSACSSKKRDDKRVLVQSGIDPETAQCAVRVSIGPTTTREEIEAFLSAAGECVKRLA